ncbi:MAG: hypothetical protein FWH05_05290 [Oscillospiraceae bacterium]|nr:hypothetical protein [Oscillospiraceae bacterium]
MDCCNKCGNTNCCCCRQDCRTCGCAVEECDMEQSFCSLIESIALIETALSHILNAEGEKLQRAISLAKNVDELLAVNKSVVRTIACVTRLETILLEKLTEVTCAMEECEPDVC